MENERTTGPALPEMEEMEALLDGHARWLRGQFAVERADGDWFEVTAPYLDRHNDALQVYVRKDGGGGYELTDDSWTVWNLCLPDPLPADIRERITAACLSHGVRLKGYELTTIATAADFAERLHGLLQAMQEVGAMEYSGPWERPQAPETGNKNTENGTMENKAVTDMKTMKNKTEVRIAFPPHFHDALRKLPPETYKEAMLAVLDYALHGEEPQGLTDMANTAFILMRDQLDNGIRG